MVQRLRERARTNALAITTAATALAPAWSLFDHALEASSTAATFAAVRLVGALVCAALLVVLWAHRWGRAYPTALAAAALGVVQLEVGWMIPQVSHLEGYLLGATLALYAAAAVLVGPPSWTAALGGLTLTGIGAGLVHVGMSSTGTGNGVWANAWNGLGDGLVDGLVDRVWDGHAALLTLFYLGTATVASYLAHALRHLSLLAEVTSRMALDGERAHTAALLVELQRLSTEDPLTGLVNRRAWDHELAAACAALSPTPPWTPVVSAALSEPAEPSGLSELWPAPHEQVALILIDVDHFKAINDHAGHAGGDEVLRMVARIISACVREGDVVARLGGDELAVLLPSASHAEAVTVAERVRANTEQLRLASHPDLRVTLSLGVAVGAGPHTVPAGLTVAADEQLYRAKVARNTVAATAP